MRVKCLAQEHKAVHQPWLKQGPAHPESMHIIRTPHLSDTEP